MCPDSCCSFVICPGSRRRRKEVLGVMAEGPLSLAGAGHWQPVPSRSGTPSSPCPRGHSPTAHGSSAGQPKGQTHLCGRDPTVLALHGEALKGEGRQISSGPGGDPSLRPPLWGREATLSPLESALTGRGWPPLATRCPPGGCGPLPGWQRAGWCPGRGQDGRGWWPPSEATGEGVKEVEGMKDDVKCPCSPPRPQQVGHGPQHHLGRVLLGASAWGDPGAQVHVGMGAPESGGEASTCSPGLGRGLGGYLQDDSADLPHTVDDGVWHP